MAPYREATAAESMEATTREGMFRLEVAPRHTIVRLGDSIRLSVTEQFAEIIRSTRRNKPRKQALQLDGARLIVARAVPTEDVGIWYEPRPGVATRLFGCRPLELLDKNALKALGELDRLAQRLGEALAPFGRGVERAMEIGHGADRILIADHGDHLVFYVRRLFREWPRRVLEVYADGRVVVVASNGLLLWGGGEREFRCTSRYGVTVLGDYIRFADRTGLDLGSVAVPWVSVAERAQIADIIGRRVHQA